MNTRFHLALAATLLLAFSHAPLARADAPTRSGTIAGSVIDRDTRQPIAQASVRLEGLGRGATTDEQGRFVLRDVPPGSHRIRAARIDYPALIVTDVVVTPGRETQVEIELAGEAVKQAEVEVKASGFAKPRDQATSSYQMSYEEIRRSPGAIGDVLRLVQSLPGVVNSNDQRNDVIARGGSPSENLVRLDNIDVPNLNHFAAQGTTGGPISMLNNELVRDASFLAGGFPAQYGARLSSIMDIRMREGSHERFLSATDVTVAGFGELLEGPLGSKGSWLLSGRTSYYDLVAKAFGINAVPYTSSGQMKAAYDASAHDKLWFVGVGGWDHINSKLKRDQLDDPYGQEFKTGGWRITNGLNWQHLFGTHAWGTLAVSDAVARFDTDVRDPYLPGAPGALIYTNASTEGETTLRYDFAGRSAAIGDWKAGLEGKWARAHFAYAQPFGTQNPFSTDTARVDRIDVNRRERGTSEAAYAQWTHAVLARTELTLGARTDRFDVLHATTFDPRAALTLHVVRPLDFNLSYGVYHQQPALAYVRAYPQNGGLSPIRAEHLVAGIAWVPAPDVKLTLEAYRKNYEAYPVASEYPAFSLANTGDVYGLQGLLLPLVSAGRGHAQGLEFYVQKKLTQGFYGQIAWSVARSEHAALDGVMHRGGYDTPNTATAIVGYKRGAAWEFSTRFSYASGRPYTPALEPFSTQQGRYIYDLTRVNESRTPVYSRMDLRADRRFSLGRRNVTMFVEMQNVFDRKNALQYIWNAKTQKLGSIPQIGFLPVTGFKIEL